MLSSTPHHTHSLSAAQNPSIQLTAALSHHTHSLSAARCAVNRMFAAALSRALFRFSSSAQRKRRGLFSGIAAEWVRGATSQTLPHPPDPDRQIFFSPATLTRMSAADDDLIVRLADTHSPTEIAAALDGRMTPSQVKARATELLDTKDWLTLVQQDALVTLKMRQVVADLEDMPLTSRTAEVMIRALETIGKRLDRRLGTTESDLQTLYGWQGRLLVSTVQTALGHLRSKFSDTISEAEWDEALAEALELARAEVKPHELASR